jgi:hypothetical protein
VLKAQAAYGPDIERKVAWATNALKDPNEMHRAAAALGMERAEAAKAVSALRTEGARLWPDAGINSDVQNGDG